MQAAQWQRARRLGGSRACRQERESGDYAFAASREPAGVIAKQVWEFCLAGVCGTIREYLSRMGRRHRPPAQGTARASGDRRRVRLRAWPRAVDDYSGTRR